MAIAKPRTISAGRGTRPRAIGFAVAIPLAALGTALGLIVAVVVGAYAGGLTRAAPPDSAKPEGAGGIVAAITGDDLGTFVEQLAGDYTKRDVTIGGGLDVDLSWPVVTVSGEDISVANAEWAERPELLTLKAMRVRLDVGALLTGDIVLPLVELSQPRLYLATSERGESNLPFATGGGDKSGGFSAENLPLVRELSIEDAALGYSNFMTGVDADLDLDRASFTAAKGEPMRLSANGVYQGQPLKIDAKGGSWSALTEPSNAAFPLDASAALGGFSAKASGSIAEPTKMKGVDLTIRIDGDGMPTVYPFARVFAAPTPAVDLTGRLTNETLEQGVRWTLSNLDARLGRSEIVGGRLAVATGGARPRVEGQVRSSRFWFDDITAFFSSPDTGATPKDQNSRILPESDFWPLAAFDLADVDVDLELNEFQGFGLAFDALSGPVAVDNGVLRFEPLRGTRGDAEAVVFLSLYSNATPVKTDVKAELNRLSLDRIAGDVPLASVPFTGRLGGNITLGMQGNSIARMLGTANGDVFLAMDDGQLSGLLVELLGLDIAESLGLIVTDGDEDTPVAIRCAVADVNLKDGAANLRHFVIDTQDTVVTAEGLVRMAPETIDLKVVPQPKDFSLLSLRSPIGIEGTFAEPEIFTDPAGLGVDTTADKVINAILTPIAGLLPPIDTGLGENSGCRKLIEEAGTNAG